MYISKKLFPSSPPSPKKDLLNMFDASLPKKTKINHLSIIVAIWQRNISWLCCSGSKRKIHSAMAISSNFDIE